MSQTCSPSTKATIEAICRALDEGGELSAVAELRRHFPLIPDNAQARPCVRAIASWQPVPAPNKGVRDPCGIDFAS